MPTQLITVGSPPLLMTDEQKEEFNSPATKMVSIKKEKSNKGKNGVDPEANFSELDSLSSSDEAAPIQKKKEMSQPKSVHWSKRKNMRPIKHVKNMSKREIGSRWYNEEDYRANKLDLKRTILLVRESEDGELDPEFENELCTRGIENALSATRYTFRRRIKTEAWGAVLDEQELQRRTRQEDCYNIAEEYKEISQLALEIAQAQARVDEDFVREQKKLIEVFI